MTGAWTSGLAEDRRGNTIVEFALVAPVMLLMMLGFGDLCQHAYAQSILNGAIQKAGRDSAIQGGANNTAAIDAKVMAMVQRVATDATYTSSRKTYQSFSRMSPEPFTDNKPANNRYDSGECFQDLNGNGVWDTDPSRGGQGGANDVTLYKIIVTYRRLFPVAGLMGGATTQTISAQTLLKNQPYATQIIADPVCRT